MARRNALLAASLTQLDPMNEKAYEKSEQSPFEEIKEIIKQLSGLVQETGEDQIKIISDGRGEGGIFEK